MKVIKTEAGYRRESWIERNEGYIISFLAGMLCSAMIMWVII